MAIPKDTLTLTAARLRSEFLYDPETGRFWRKVGSNHTGYIRIKFDGRFHMAHRLAWLYMTDKWPSGEVDHINTQRDDNRWINLRDGSHSQNMLNHTRKGGVSGAVGVYWRARNKKWGAVYAGKWLGLFRKKEDAIAARQRQR